MKNWTAVTVREHVNHYMMGNDGRERLLTDHGRGLKLEQASIMRFADWDDRRLPTLCTSDLDHVARVLNDVDAELTGEKHCPYLDTLEADDPCHAAIRPNGKAVSP